MRRRSTRWLLVESYLGVIGMVIIILLSPAIVYYGAAYGIPGSAGVSPWVCVAAMFLLGVPYAIWWASRRSAGSASETEPVETDADSDQEPTPEHDSA